MDKLDRRRVNHLVNKALAGDRRKLVEALKMIDDIENGDARRKRADWDILFAFYGRWKSLIEQEIQERKGVDASYWDFEKKKERKLESAPWYKAVHGDKPSNSSA